MRKNRANKIDKIDEIPTAKEAYAKSSLITPDQIFGRRWNACKYIIKEKINHAINQGLYSTTVISIDTKTSEDNRFLDYVIEKLEEMGYTVTFQELVSQSKTIVSAYWREVR